MKEENLKNKIVNATKWSSITEIAAKIVSPITNMILARVISPEAFGVVATVTMIFSFADMLTDAGFQKYLVQHEFKNNEEKYKCVNVAFWTNLGISFFLWGVIIFFRNKLALSVGNPGLGNVIMIACIQLPITAFSSIQMALYRRHFDFKTLLIVRLYLILIPFIITIPLALLGFSYWALIIGTICSQLFNAIILTIKSKWKPKFFYSKEILIDMLSFSIWSLIEAISIWLTMWVDAFIIGNSLNQYYLGIYKTSTAMVNTLMSLITASIVPVLFSALSRLQNDSDKFNRMYFNTQRIASVFIFPLGIGVYLYSDLATKILLGSKWNEASGVVGIWAFTSAITIVFGYFSSEVYRAKGRPKLSFLAQLLHLLVLVPTCIISSKYGFWPLVYARSWIRMEFVVVHLIIMKVAIGIPIIKTIKNVFPAFISAVAMGVLGYLLQQISKGLLWSIVSIIICSLFYWGVLYLFSNIRKEMNGILIKLKPRLAKGK
ncbi:lipopolysaccharide biosynthesis protein [Clostridium sp.]|uniref:lipopolysaccharide biosynthesis protein n=1 Tax=Clostridium sp. TaxID=1506 RepID=UPI003D6C77C8